MLRGVLSVPLTSVRYFTANAAALRLNELDNVDAIIMGCPTYMGAISIGMKDFIEAAATRWYTHSWNNKIAGAFTNSSSFPGDKLNTLIGLVINAMQHGMIFVGLGIIPATNKFEDMAQLEGSESKFINHESSLIGPISGSIQFNLDAPPSKEDLDTAESYGRRVGEITLQFVRGRMAQTEAALISEIIPTPYAHQIGTQLS